MFHSFLILARMQGINLSHTGNLQPQFLLLQFSSSEAQRTSGFKARLLFLPYVKNDFGDVKKISLKTKGNRITLNNG